MSLKIPLSTVAALAMTLALGSCRHQQRRSQQVIDRAGPTQAPHQCTPAPSYALSPAAHDQCVDPIHSPRMSRWRPLVRRIVGARHDDIALLMAMMFIESGGRQYAVSRSGCAGLMQFCDTTALRPPFDRIFDIDRLRPCACLRRRCYIRRPERRFLETTAAALHPIIAADFPCSLSDARFDPEAAIRAGWTYISDLARAFDRNIYLVYIGYNSGPPVAASLWRQLGSRRARRLEEIRRMLPRALTPSFGRRWARRRAKALLNVHLPKLARVYRAYGGRTAITVGVRADKR